MLLYTCRCLFGFTLNNKLFVKWVFIKITNLSEGILPPNIESFLTKPQKTSAVETVLLFYVKRDVVKIFFVNVFTSR